MNEDDPLEGVAGPHTGCRARRNGRKPGQKAVETISAPFDPEWLDLNELIIDVMAQLLPLVLHHDLRWRLARVLPLLWGDRNKLIQVFFCLISNAIRYAPAESAIYVTTAAEGRVVHVRICDRGESRMLSRPRSLFPAYCRVRRLDLSLDRLIDDNLPLVYTIVRMHGGRAWIESDVHEGFIFHFTLPFPASD
jgi:signal transduction histidine kinase